MISRTKVGLLRETGMGANLNISKVVYPNPFADPGGFAHLETPRVFHPQTGLQHDPRPNDRSEQPQYGTLQRARWIERPTHKRSPEEEPEYPNDD